MLHGLHIWLCLLIAVAASRPGDMSSFFLKAPKSVPRAGRAAPGQYDGFFIKTSKTVPRIGRRNGVQTGERQDLQDSIHRQFQQAENVHTSNFNDDFPIHKTQDNYVVNFDTWRQNNHPENYIIENDDDHDYEDQLDSLVMDRHLQHQLENEEDNLIKERGNLDIFMHQ